MGSGSCPWITSFLGRYELYISSEIDVLKWSTESWSQDQIFVIEVMTVFLSLSSVQLHKTALGGFMLFSLFFWVKIDLDQLSSVYETHPSHRTSPYSWPGSLTGGENRLLLFLLWSGYGRMEGGKIAPPHLTCFSQVFLVDFSHSFETSEGV